MILAVDIGGTKIAAALLDEDGELRAEQRTPTPVDSAETTFTAVGEVIDAVLAGTRPDAVGVACAGPVDHLTDTVSPINIPHWRGFPLRKRLRDRLGCEVTVAGDGVCMALGEHWAGAGRGAWFMTGLVVSTGVGGGLVLDGKPYLGRTGNAGHLGHVVVEEDGWPCTCGGRGCVETVAAGPHLVRWARQQGWQAPESADAATLAADAHNGNKIALAAFRRSGWAVGLAIAATAVVCDLDLAVVGGGVAQAGDLLFDPIRESVAEHAKLSYAADLKVVPAELGGRAGLYGAAALAAQARGTRPIK
ncbi:ROK family protein [Labedaea rhizosphaerae]|uniref:Glucokinase n=1 Tax=Labedaea rhizosphaerae TaxID=598644 RepID=A0A4R6SMA2_LABRH|nr:ROK family protein [Labedaea rhizosphaerae]TDQ05259.1 glucokinase [Labedaea rhizosphaerae]